MGPSSPFSKVAPVLPWYEYVESLERQGFSCQGIMVVCASLIETTVYFPRKCSSTNAQQYIQRGLIGFAKMERILLRELCGE